MSDGLIFISLAIELAGAIDFYFEIQKWERTSFRTSKEEALADMEQKIRKLIEQVDIAKKEIST